MSNDASASIGRSLSFESPVVDIQTQNTNETSTKAPPVIKTKTSTPVVYRGMAKQLWVNAEKTTGVKPKGTLAAWSLVFQRLVRHKINGSKIKAGRARCQKALNWYCAKRLIFRNRNQKELQNNFFLDIRSAQAFYDDFERVERDMSNPDWNEGYSAITEDPVDRAHRNMHFTGRVIHSGTKEFDKMMRQNGNG